MASVKPRGNGVWLITVSSGYGPDGKQVRTYRTFRADPTHTEISQRREAERYAAALETDIQRNLITATKKTSLNDVFEEFIGVRKLAASTRAWYRHIYEGRLEQSLGKKAVQDLTPRDINGFYKMLRTTAAKTERSKTGFLSGTAQSAYHRVLHAVLEFAKRSGYITINPADAVEPPQKDTEETEHLEPEDVARLMDVLDHLPDTQWRLFFTAMLFTGCRPGELIGLNWSDIDGDTLRISAGSLQEKGKKTVRTDRPKTRSSIRTIILPPQVVVLLNKHRAEQSAYRLKFGPAWPEESADAVFTGAEGYRLNISSPTQKFQKILKQHDLPPVRLYALRHTAASIMIGAGLPVTDVAAQLGHSQPSTTLNIYSHAFAAANRRASSAISDAIEAARSKASGE